MTPESAPDNPDGSQHAQRMTYIQPFHVMEVLAQAQAREKAGYDVIHLEVGEPDTIRQKRDRTRSVSRSYPVLPQHCRLRSPFC